MTAGPNQPPFSGWMVKDWDTSANRYVPDSTMTCCIPTATPPCCLTLTLSGEARELHGRLEGTYTDTGLVSMGRPVIILLIDILCCCDFFPCRSSSSRASSCLWQSGTSTGASGRALGEKPPFCGAVRLGRRALPTLAIRLTRNWAVGTGDSKRKVVRVNGYLRGFTFSVVFINTSEQ